MLLKNETTGASADFAVPQPGWRELTQEEEDDYLLEEARKAKQITLDTALNVFCNIGFPHDEVYFCLSGDIINDIIVQNQLLSYESSDVSVDATTKIYTLPSGHGLTFWSEQHIEWLGFTEGDNNGEKTVTLFSGDEITVEEALADEAAGDPVSVSTVNRYRQYDTVGILQSFGDKAGWDDFFKKITPERIRVMNYFYATKKLINDATTMTILDAIVIDFSV